MPYCIACGHEAKRLIPQGDNRPRLVCPSCGYIHYENPKVVTGALCLHEDKILLCRRAIEPRYGFWTLPAGFLEIGESVKQGAIRETYEEAQGVGQNLQLYALFDLPRIGQIHAMYLATLKDGAFGAGSESLECRLFLPSQIPWADLSFETVRRTLDYYCQDLRRHQSPQKVRQNAVGVRQVVLSDHKNL